MIKSNIWLVGTGAMARDYAKVLNDLGCQYIAIGRGDINNSSFLDATGVQPISGGLDDYLRSDPGRPAAVINAVGIDALTETTRSLLDYGVDYLLLEKPGFGYPEELQDTVDLSNRTGSKIVLAYNRRFYASVLKAKEIIKDDGGVSSFFFEFTEWSHVIEKLDKTRVEHENWFYGNSSHVIDMAFYLCGIPKQMSTYKAGGLDWHPSGSKYAGAGITDNGALFSYIANWESPGRWSVEILTAKHRLIFRPMESLQLQKIGSVAVESVQLDNQLDISYKPGLYLQTKAFLEKDLSDFCSIDEQLIRSNSIYRSINGNSTSKDWQ